MDAVCARDVDMRPVPERGEGAERVVPGTADGVEQAGAAGVSGVYRPSVEAGPEIAVVLPQGTVLEGPDGGADRHCAQQQKPEG